ncbi:VOC family protein [Streptomyces sp. NPDC050636]|uniref:VOC family protein n=1 Tax=Streptomyces sp. NPDC050636 TaxID=3154510 RepID=UPI00341D8179
MKNNLDSFSMVVPDLAPAVSLFHSVFGAEELDRGTVNDHGAAARQAVLSLDPHTRLRLFEYEKTSGSPFTASVTDIGTAHFCFRVGDIEKATQFIKHCSGIRVLGEITEIPDGPLRHHKWVYFRLPWGAFCELQEWPETPSAEAQLLFHDQLSQHRSPVPTMMGLDHVGYSVRDLESAVELLEGSLGGKRILGSVTEADESFMLRQFEEAVSVRMKMAMVRIGEHTNIELFEHVVADRRGLAERLDIGNSRMTFATENPVRSGDELSERFGFSRVGQGSTELLDDEALFTSLSGLDIEFSRAASRK